MNFLQKAVSKALGLGWVPESQLWGAGVAHWTNWNFRAYAEEAFQANPYVFRAVCALQQAMSGVGVSCQVLKGQDYTDLPETHDAYKLQRQPAPLYPWGAWVEAMVGFRLLGGQAFGLGVGPDKANTPNPRPPRQVHPMGPDVMAALPGALAGGNQPALGNLGGFEYRPKGNPTLLQPSEVFWWPSWNPLDLMDGTPNCKPCDRAIDANNGALSYNKAILDNGGFVGTMFSTDSQSIGSTQAKEMQESFDIKYRGASKAGKTFFGWGGLKPYKVGLTPAEMGFGELSTLTAVQVALAFGVPSELLGGPPKTFSNYKEARQALYSDTALPMLNDLCSRFGRFLSVRFGEEIAVIPDADSVAALSGAREERTTTTRENWKAGLLTRNEARLDMGWAELPDASGAEFFAGPQPFTLQNAGGKSFIGYRGHKCKGKHFEY